METKGRGAVRGRPIVSASQAAGCFFVWFLGQRADPLNAGHVFVAGESGCMACRRSAARSRASSRHVLHHRAPVTGARHVRLGRQHKHASMARLNIIDLRRPNAMGTRIGQDVIGRRRPHKGEGTGPKMSSTLECPLHSHLAVVMRERSYKCVRTPVD